MLVYARGIRDSGGIKSLGLSNLELKDAIVDKYSVLFPNDDCIQVELVLTCKDERQVRIILVQDI